MEAYHNSRELKFRSPFGAVTPGAPVRITIDIWNGRPVSAVLRTGRNQEACKLLPMEISERTGGYTAAVTFTPETTGVFWYSFELTGEDGSHIYYAPQSGRTGGAGAVYYEAPGTSYQITSAKRRELPGWYKDGIVYQIFPDRFARAEGDTTDDVAARLKGHGHNPAARRAVRWDKPPAYERNDDGSIRQWDFYGGSLNGIREKLPYLKELGISIIYLNPIFEAMSSHRYDTGDYFTIDPVLGTEEDFKRLCGEAAKYGISVILDGVFNHTGCDSIYFNKYGNYPGTGAYQSEDSKYRGWYVFNDNTACGYDSWWGVTDLPNADESSASYREFMYAGADSVVRHWLKAGARGWRLDVADEIPDEFIAGVKKAAVETLGDDALLLGEVWEDASNKVSYGVLRQYFEGDELDCVMNYPFREGVGGFLTGEVNAQDMCERMYSLYENYPETAFKGALNLIGSHDRLRVMTLLGGAPAQGRLSDSQKMDYKLDPGMRGLAKSRLWLAALLQMTMPGVPCIYYGDEAGMEGYSDPYNRAAFPWGKEDGDCRTIYMNAIGIRRSSRVFVDGSFEPFAIGDDVFGFTRRLGDEAVTVLINRSLSAQHDVEIDRLGEFACDIVSGKLLFNGEEAGNGATADGAADGGLPQGDSGKTFVPGKVKVHLYQLGSAVVYFSKAERLGRKLEAGTGVLCHITSLPNGGRPGTIGKPSRDFIDLLSRHGEHYWQILPVTPADHTGSPYAGSSAFAGNLKLTGLSDEDYEAEYNEFIKAAGSDYEIRPAAGYTQAVHGLNGHALPGGGSSGAVTGTPETVPESGAAGYIGFIRENAYWIDGYAMYMAIKDKNGGKAWMDWDKKYHGYSEALWDDSELAVMADRYRHAQFIFHGMWAETRAYAKLHGIEIIGDMPIYVSADSADAWAYPDMFTLGGESGGMAMEAGVPADRFAAEGQLWGNPLYRWDYMEKNGYRWWIEKLRRALALYDIVRLDHFRGFEAYWAVPKGKKALYGKWMEGPGRRLFEAAYRELGPLPVIAEDLGFITPGVRALLAVTGFPGMDIMEFSDSDPANGYTVAKNRIAYTGTHDNETLFEWVSKRYGKQMSKVQTADSGAADAGESLDTAAAVRETGQDGSGSSTDDESVRLHGICDKLLKDFYHCGADVRIVPLQDLLGLGAEARMNVPGTVGTNWKWQAKAPIEWEDRK